MRNISKRGAIELSIGTIVIIVLAMSMLILGIVLVKNIFGVGMDVTDVIGNEVEQEITNMFGEGDKLAMAPSARRKDVQVGEKTGFGFAIANKISGGEGQDAKFSYDIAVSDENLRDCGLRAAEVEKWIKSGRTLPIGAISTSQPFKAIILMTIPENAPLCTVTYIITVKADGVVYDTSSMAISVEN